MGQAELLIAGLLVAVAGLSTLAPPVGAVSDRARRRRRPARIRSRAARGEARPRGRAARLLAADSLRRIDLREFRRCPGQPARAHAQRGRAGARDDGRGRLGRARARPGPALESRTWSGRSTGDPPSGRGTWERGGAW